MTQEEFYLWILNCTSIAPRFPDFNSEFLKNYEIAKLFLEKFGIHALNEEKQRKLNLDAVFSWFRISSWIELQYDIPEILELLPERIPRHLDVSYPKVKSLPKLESVGGYLYLKNSQIQSLPELESIGEYIDIQYSEIKSLPKLISVGGKIVVSFSGETYWKNYFNELGRTDLADKVCC